MFCSNCGKEAAGSDRFCVSCGNPLHDSHRINQKTEERKKAPQSGMSLGLAIAGLLLSLFPILSYPCSITGFVMSRKAKEVESQSYGSASTSSKAAFVLSLAAIVTTSLVILISLPYNIERNFG